MHTITFILKEETSGTAKFIEVTDEDQYPRTRGVYVNKPAWAQDGKPRGYRVTLEPLTDA